MFQANKIHLQEVRRISQEMQHVITTMNNPLEAVDDVDNNAGVVARVGDDDQVVLPAAHCNCPVMYVWGGPLQFLPQKFVLPKMNL